LLAGGGVDQMRDRVVARRQFQIAQVHGSEIGRLPRNDRTDLRVEPERASGRQRGHGERLLRGYRGRASGGGLGEEGSGTHFLEQVQPVVACRAIRAYADVYTSLDKCRNWCDPAREFEVGTRAMCHMASGLSKYGDFLW